MNSIERAWLTLRHRLRSVVRLYQFVKLPSALLKCGSSLISKG
jgi:hypothetical protein